MVRISTKGRYGTRFMLELAMNFSQGPVHLREIASSEGISEGYLQHIVDTLKGSGLVFSHRVSHGGYTLAKKPEEITLRDILASLEGSIALAECVTNPDICERSPYCTTRDVWKNLYEKFLRSLDEITLKSMVEHRTMREKNTLHYEI
ncbi:MAG: Rrf2 family transcriptional regulator [Spirochaetes bacterium]|nr:Rrf2 family transcriptional regulator [Spirochaetota bacterium]